jgi:predicted CoA-binding protein
MTTIGDIKEFLALRRVALIGVSRNPGDFSRRLFHEMCERGYDMVPINPIAEEIEDRQCFPCLQVVKPPVDGVLVMTPFHQTLRVVRDCAEAGIRRVWMYRAAGKGAVSAEAVNFCRANGIQVVEGYCPYMFLPGGSFPHRAHGLLMQLTHRYPARAA